MAASGAAACSESTSTDRLAAGRASSPRSWTGLATLLPPRSRSPVARCSASATRMFGSIAFGGGAILGERPLAADGIEPPATVDSYWGDGFGVMRAERRFIAGDPQPTSDFREVSSPLTAEMLRPAPTGRGVVQFRTRLTDDDFAAPRRVVPRVPGDDAARLRLLRPLDHRPRVPALLPHAAAVRRGRAVGLADIARRPAPSAPGARRAGDRGHEGTARPGRPVALPGAAVALPRGSDEAPGGDLGSAPAVRPHVAIDHDARPVAAPAADGPPLAGPQARRHARSRSAPAGGRALVPRALDDPWPDRRLRRSATSARSVRCSSRRCGRSRCFRT